MTASLATRPAAHGGGLRTVGACGALALLAIALYAGALDGPFVFDDAVAIERNPWIRSLWPPSIPFSPPDDTPVAGRPLANATFALSYALGGLRPGGYRIVNLALHAACACVLFSLLRRTLRACGRGSADGTAFAASALWLVHPLTSECVLYATQRTESLMALCYLLTLEGTSRASLLSDAAGRRRGRWLAIAAAVAGMACKESMVSAPLAALLYDRSYASGSLRAALGRRRSLYLGLASSWLVLGALQLGAPRSLSAGFGAGVDVPTYLAHQMEMLTTYLKLVFWPHPLVFDYGWPLPLAFSDVLGPALVVAAWCGAALWLAWRRPALGFPLLVGLLVLAPSSSFVPIATEVGAERRMYLPLAGIVALLAAGASAALRRWLTTRRSVRRTGTLVTAQLVVALGGTTRARARDYADEERLWRSVIHVRPEQPRALLNLGEVMRERGRLDEAETLFAAALLLYPSYARAEAHLGLVAEDRGRHEVAEAHLLRALELDPKHGDVRTNLGEIQARAGHVDAALATWREALALDPGLAYAANNLAWVLATHPSDRYRDGAEAVRLAERATRLSAGQDAAVLDTLAAAYAESGRFERAVETADRAIAIARATGRSEQARASEARRALYASRRPFRDPGPEP